MPLVARPPAVAAIGTAYLQLVVAVLGSVLGCGAIAMALMEDQFTLRLYIHLSGFTVAIACSFYIVFTGKDLERAALLNGMPQTAKRVVQISAWGTLATLLALSSLLPLLLPLLGRSRGARLPFSFWVDMVTYAGCAILFILVLWSICNRLLSFDSKATRTPEAARDRIHVCFGSSDHGTEAPELPAGESIVYATPPLWRTSARIIAQDEESSSISVEAPIDQVDDVEEELAGDERWLVLRLLDGKRVRLHPLQRELLPSTLDTFRFAFLNRLSGADAELALRVQSQISAQLEPGETVRYAARGSQRSWLMSPKRRNDAGFAVTNLRVLPYRPSTRAPGLRLDTASDITVRPLGPDMSPWHRWEVARWSERQILERLIVIAHAEDIHHLMFSIADATRGPMSILPAAFRLW